MANGNGSDVLGNGGVTSSIVDALGLGVDPVLEDEQRQEGPRDLPEVYDLLRGVSGDVEGLQRELQSEATPRRRESVYTVFTNPVSEVPLALDETAPDDIERPELLRTFPQQLGVGTGEAVLLYPRGLGAHEEGLPGSEPRPVAIGSPGTVFESLVIHRPVKMGF